MILHCAVHGEVNIGSTWDEPYCPLCMEDESMLDLEELPEMFIVDPTSSLEVDDA